MNTRLLKKIGTALTVVFLINACGQDQHQESETKDLTIPQREKPLIIYLGGNRSCGTEDQESSFLHNTIYTQGESIFQRRYKYDYITNCFTDGSEYLHYFHSKNLQLVNSIVTNNRSRDVKQFYHYVNQILNRSLKRKVFFIAHSYGAWLAAQTVLHLQSASFHEVYLFTIDPISFPRCNFRRPWACNSFPEDITLNAQRMLSKKTKYWENIYQEETWYLHSSHAVFADRNLQIEAPHQGIDLDSSTWASIHSFIYSSYRGSAFRR